MFAHISSTASSPLSLSVSLVAPTLASYAAALCLLLAYKHSMLHARCCHMQSERSRAATATGCELSRQMTLKRVNISNAHVNACKHFFSRVHVYSARQSVRLYLQPPLFWVSNFSAQLMVIVSLSAICLIAVSGGKVASARSAATSRDLFDVSPSINTCDCLFGAFFVLTSVVRSFQNRYFALFWSTAKIISSL